MLGNVTVNTSAIGPGTFPNVEGVALFIGEAANNPGVATPVGLNSDLATQFGAGSLQDTLAVARLNGGPNWKAYAIGHTAVQGWADVIAAGLAAVNPELVVVCKPVTAAAELTAMQTKAAALELLAQRTLWLAAFRGIDNTPVTGDANLAAYLAAAQALTNGVSGQRVMVVPQLYGGELGAFAGKLAAFAFESKINRSPMRVRSGAVVDPGAKPSDTTGAELDLATLTALDAARFSVFQWYLGKEGVYCANANTLEAAAGDFPFAEWLRIIDKAARAVRLEAIDAIADDAVQNTPAGNAAFATRLGAPLRTMAQAGEIRPLAKDAIAITWPGINQVQVFMTVQPPNAPKDITVSITLDKQSA